MIHNLHDLVYRYYNRMLFLFTPNVCNAKCSFCYIKPKFSISAVLGNSILAKTDEFVNAAVNIGFNEFRITGGEPLIFENIHELLSIFKKNGIFYTLLTNGMNIKKYFKLLETNRPKKLTVSYHSKMHHSSIFGIKYNTDLLDKSIRQLCEMGINITISILVLEENKDEVISHVLHLKSLGIKSIKLIYPNDAKIKMILTNEFSEIVKRLSSITELEVRYSDFKTNMCNVISRGFLSFNTSQNTVYGCCNSINNKKFINTDTSFDALTAILWNFYREAQVLNEFPCENHVKFCPIALNN